MDYKNKKSIQPSEVPSSKRKSSADYGKGKAMRKKPLLKRIKLFFRAFFEVLREEFSEKISDFQKRKQKHPKRKQDPEAVYKKEEIQRKKESRKQLKMLHKMQEENKVRKKNAKKSPRSQEKIPGKRELVILLSICIAEAMMFLTVGVLFIKDHLDAMPSSVVMTVEESRFVQKSKLSSKEAFPHGEDQPYFSMNFLSEVLSVKTVSDGNYMYYTFENGEQLVMKKGSHNVKINGEKIVLPGAIQVTERGVFVPLELITKYSSGLVVSYNSEERILTFTREKDETKSDSEKTVYKGLSFHIRKQEPAPVPQVTEGEK